jgi:hypothetical protein
LPALPGGPECAWFPSPFPQPGRSSTAAATGGADASTGGEAGAGGGTGVAGVGAGGGVGGGVGFGGGAGAGGEGGVEGLPVGPSFGPDAPARGPEALAPSLEGGASLPASPASRVAVGPGASDGSAAGAGFGCLTSGVACRAGRAAFTTIGSRRITRRRSGARAPYTGPVLAGGAASVFGSVVAVGDLSSNRLSSLSPSRAARHR